MPPCSTPSGLGVFGVLLLLLNRLALFTIQKVVRGKSLFPVTLLPQPPSPLPEISSVNRVSGILPGIGQKFLPFTQMHRTFTLLCSLNYLFCRYLGLFQSEFWVQYADMQGDGESRFGSCLPWRCGLEENPGPRGPRRTDSHGPTGSLPPPSPNFP